MVKTKTSLHSLAMKIILLFPVTTISIPSVNKFCFAIAAIFMVLTLLTKRFRVTDMLLLFTTVLIYIWTIVVTDEVAININEYFYFVFFVIYTYFIITDKQRFEDFCKKNTQYIFGVVVVWSIIVAISFFFSSSYKNGAFVSFTGDTFRMSMAASYILALVLLLVGKNKRFFILSILPMFAIISGASRTYFAVGIAIFLVILYAFCGDLKRFMLILVPVGIIFAMALLGSGIMAKFDSSLNVDQSDYYQDPIAKFTSGRSLFWVSDISAYMSSGVINQILGNGFNFVYNVNRAVFGNAIWAHNDFLGILLNYGFIGLLIYLITYVKLISSYKEELKKSKILLVTVVFIWLFNAFFNMFYTYFCAVAAYPFIIYGVSCIIEDANARKAIKQKNILM